MKFGCVLKQRNRRALDTVLKWFDLSGDATTMESARKMATDVVNLLTGHGIGMDTATTTTATTVAARSEPDKGSIHGSQRDKDSNHDSTTHQGSTRTPSSFNLSDSLYDKTYKRKK